MVVYADILFFNNTLMTFAILWAVSKILELKVSYWRLLLGAVIGTIYSFLILYIQFRDWYYFYNFLLHISLNIITAYLMIYFAFGKLSLKIFIKAIGYLYLVSFIVIGTILSLFYIYGIQPFQVENDIIIILAILIVLIIGKIGWGIFHNYITPEELYISLKIIINDNYVNLIGLIDTGNQLSDPLNGFPVLIVNVDHLNSIFPGEISKHFKEMNKINIIELFARYDWEDRIRILPYSDIGQEHGILLGIRPDKVILEYQKDIIETEKVILGITDIRLDPKNKYQVLVPPGLLKEK
ncbi:MAG: sigma-E processing peptidase SpoIIGA [Bacillota bacterium]